jgi:uncharacterized membrane protein YedE/YeeE
MKAIHAKMGLFGLLLGIALSSIGFTDFGEIHSMFKFQEARLFLTYGLGIGVATVGFLVLRQARQMRPRPLHRGTVAGGLIFGAGWAITGACPAGALAQLGEGRVVAVFTVMGVVAGAWLYPVVHARFFRWPMVVCEA